MKGTRAPYVALSFDQPPLYLIYVIEDIRWIYPSHTAAIRSPNLSPTSSALISDDDLLFYGPQRFTRSLLSIIPVLEIENGV
jgi:hypothetical protein